MKVKLFFKGKIPESQNWRFSLKILVFMPIKKCNTGTPRLRETGSFQVSEDLPNGGSMIGMTNLRLINA
jgi:hypothetical protein